MFRNYEEMTENHWKIHENHLNNFLSFQIYSGCWDRNVGITNSCLSFKKDARILIASVHSAANQLKLKKNTKDCPTMALNCDILSCLLFQI